MKKRWVLFPYIIWMITFIIAPIGLVVCFAFTGTTNEFTFENIINVFNYSGVFLKSLWLGFFATLICLVLGYPMAYIISKMREKGQGIAIILIMLPMWVNFLLRTYACMTLIEDSGLLNQLLVFCGLPRLHLINTPIAVAIGMVYDFLPYMILPIYSTLIKIDTHIIEAAQDLGTNRTKVFSKIIFPLSIPGVISGVTMVFVPAVSTFIVSKMLGGSSDFLIGDLIDMQFLGSAYNPNAGSAISLVLMALILICVGIMNKLGKTS